MLYELIFKPYENSKQYNSMTKNYFDSTYLVASRALFLPVGATEATVRVLAILEIKPTDCAVPFTGEEQDIMMKRAREEENG